MPLNDDCINPIFCSGCASIFAWPAQFIQQEIEQAVLGIFDIAARPYLKIGEMTLAFSLELFIKILKGFKKSFLYKQKINKDEKDFVFNWKDTKERAIYFEEKIKQE